jgi:hypothetical protein
VAGHTIDRIGITTLAVPNFVAVMIPIAIFAWIVGRDDPMRDWIRGLLIPGLGWVGLILIVDSIRQRLPRR